MPHTPQATQHGDAVIVDVGDELDISRSALMRSVTHMMRAKTIGTVMVDLRETKQLRDSGMALLLNLHRRAKAAQQQVYLLHCPPEFRHRMSAAGIDRLFHFAG